MKNILVIDDEKRIQDIYTAILTKEGFNVTRALSAVEANEVLKREEIDLVLLDIKMPRVDGAGVDGTIMYGVMQLFHKNTKVIVSSVYPIYEQKRLIPDAEDYHDKGQGTEILLEKINNVLRN
ncbi:MAG: response regulator [Candidatus Omnitrophota bacterium]